jgi:hypothetical protein
MTIAAKLGAIDLESALFSGLKPYRNPHSRDRILCKPHGNDLERMYDVFRGNKQYYRFGLTVALHHEWHMEIINGLNVILALRIGRVDAKCVFIVHKSHALSAKLAVLARITEIPVELLRNNLNNGCLALLWKIVDRLGPEWNGQANQQQHLDERDSYFDVIRSVVPHAVIVGFRIPRPVKPKHRVKKIGQPTDEQHDHQPMHVDNQFIDILPLFGGQDGQS